MFGQGYKEVSEEELTTGISQVTEHKGLPCVPATVLNIPQGAIPLRPWELSHSTRLTPGQEPSFYKRSGKVSSWLVWRVLSGVTGVFLAIIWLPFTQTARWMVAPPSLPRGAEKTRANRKDLAAGDGAGGRISTSTGGVVSHKDWSYYYYEIIKS